MLWKRIKESTGYPPESIGYLTNWGKGVTIIARALQGGDGLKGIPHSVIMDEAEVLLATRVIALCLEPVDDIWTSLATSLDLIAELYRAVRQPKFPNSVGTPSMPETEKCAAKLSVRAL